MADIVPLGKTSEKKEGEDRQKEFSDPDPYKYIDRDYGDYEWCSREIDRGDYEWGDSPNDY